VALATNVGSVVLFANTYSCALGVLDCAPNTPTAEVTIAPPDEILAIIVPLEFCHSCRLAVCDAAPLIVATTFVVEIVLLTKKFVPVIRVEPTPI